MTCLCCCYGGEGDPHDHQGEDENPDKRINFEASNDSMKFEQPVGGKSRTTSFAESPNNDVTTSQGGAANHRDHDAIPRGLAGDTPKKQSSEDREKGQLTEKGVERFETEEKNIEASYENIAPKSLFNKDIEVKSDSPPDHPNEMKEELASREKEILEMRGQKSRLENQLHTCNETLAERNRCIALKIEELNTRAHMIEELSTSLDNARQSNIELKTERDELRGVIVQLEKDKSELEEKIESMLHKKVILYTAQGEGNFGSAVDEVLGKMKTSHGDVQIDFLDWESATSGSEFPLLVLCLKTSRLGTDVNNTMSHVKAKDARETYLILFHHVAPHQVGSITASASQLVTETERFNIKKIIDVAFWSGKLSDCTRNGEMIQELVRHVAK